MPDRPTPHRRSTATDRRFPFVRNMRGGGHRVGQNLDLLCAFCNILIMTDLCFECGLPATFNHHVVPKSLGGKKTVPLCKKCHSIVHSPESSLCIKKLARIAGSRKPYKLNLEKCHRLEQLRGKATCREAAKIVGVSHDTVHRFWKMKGVGFIRRDYETARQLFNPSAI